MARDRLSKKHGRPIQTDACASIDLGTLQVLVESLPSPAFLTDATAGFTVRFWNKAAENAFHLTQAAVVGKSPLAFWPKAHAESHLASESRALAERRPVEFRIESRTFRKIPLSRDGQAPVQYVLCVMEDGAELAHSHQEVARLSGELRQIQAIAKMGIWHFDFRTRHLTWSSEQSRIFDLPPTPYQEDLNEFYRQRIHPEDRMQWDRYLERAQSHGMDFTFDHRVVFDGTSSVKNVQVIGKVQRDASGVIRSVFGTCQDTTENVKRQEESRFIFDALQIGVWKFNPADHSLFWDKSMYRLFDVSESDFSGHYQAWESSLTSEAKAKAVQELEQALRGEKEFDTVFEIQTKSRGRRFISGQGKVVRDNDGRPLMMYGVNIDVTAQRSNEVELERLSRFLEVVLQNVPSIISVKDYQDNLSFSLLNKAGEKLLGFTEKQVLGKNDFDLLPRERAEINQSKDKEIFSNKQVVKIDKEELDTPSGKRFLSTYKVPTYRPNGEPHLLICISNDITEELEAKLSLDLERTKSLRSAKLASLGEMSAGIAHEINNPVAIILGMVRLIPTLAPDPAKLLAKVQTIEKAANRIAKIVAGLKKFSRSSDKSERQLRSLSDIVKESIGLTLAKSIRDLTPVEFESQTDAQVLCDEIEIEQILVNLINNAIDAAKALSEKWVRITLFEDGPTMVLQVRDSGKGIPPEIQKNLFHPFFTTKPVGEGTGLGLSIVKGILDEHKATIEILATDPNTCFEIRFQKAEAVKNAA